ncbi:ATP/GTP-binding protein [Chryseolinea sp. T2]|uniref:SMP-30/gluconolactonase/LRE family protein n=1 Tax=Chryseolinea sp. T2 TaxID=3129255 RepID=UPI003077731C
MKKALVIVLLASGFGATAQSLTLKWKTPPNIPVPESVAFEPKGNVLYVACINGKPEEKDGNGTIAKVGVDGKIVAVDWATGLDAPKGMGIYNGNLYVADITQVRTISLATGKITSSLEIEGAQFLNDITVDKKGNVYVSDTQTGKIHLVKGGKAEVYFESPELNGVNGLLALDNGLYIVSFATGNSYKLGADKKLTPFTKVVEGADGIVAVGKDEYLVSNWHGEVYYVDAKGARKLVDTKDKVNAADIEYDAKTKTLYIPTFFANSVDAYTFSK